MTCVAGHNLPPAKIHLVQSADHLHHPPRHLLSRIVVGIARPIAAALFDMTIGAVESQCCGEESHRAHELIDGNALQDLDVLKDFFRHRRPLAGGSLNNGKRYRQEPQHGYLQLSVALRSFPSGGCSLNSMRPPLGSVMLARMPPVNALGPFGSVTIRPRSRNRATALL